MAGNVWEWTATFCGNYAPCAGNFDHGPTARVRRGGAWTTPKAQYVQVVTRVAGAGSQRGNDVGFRCAKDPPK